MAVDKPEAKPRSPIRNEPMRLPGQSIEEARRAGWEQIDEPLLAAALAWSLVLQECSAKLLDTRMGLVPTAILAVIVTAWALPKIRACRRKDADYQLGRQGELAVAECLESLRAQGFRPLQDIVAGRFNVDHVLIGPPGIFAIETKTRRKSGGREEKVLVDGSRILIAGRNLEPNPAEQAKGNAAWLRGLLTRSTGREFRVDPVVVFPGWWVEFNQKRNGLFVMNEKGFENIIAKLPATLTKEEIAMAAFHLEQFVRATASNSESKS